MLCGVRAGAAEFADADDDTDEVGANDDAGGDETDDIGAKVDGTELVCGNDIG